MRSRTSRTAWPRRGRNANVSFLKIVCHLSSERKQRIIADSLRSNARLFGGLLTSWTSYPLHNALCDLIKHRQINYIDRITLLRIATVSSGPDDSAIHGMTRAHSPRMRARDLAAWPARALTLDLPEAREQGMPDARCTGGLVCNGLERSAHEHTGSAEALRHSLRNGFTAYTCSSRRRIPLATVASGLRLVWSPVGPTRLRRLDISHGCQNHTTSPYAAPSPAISPDEMPAKIRGEGLETPVACAAEGSLTGEPALQPRSRPTPLRPPHPTPRP
jgi:hypothetical protein